MTMTQQRVLDYMANGATVSTVKSAAPSARGVKFYPPIKGARQATMDALVKAGRIECVGTYSTPNQYDDNGLSLYGGYQAVYKIKSA